MKFNEKEMGLLAQRKGQIDGRLQHKPPPGTFKDTAFRERYFKLINNLLFYFKLNEFGQVDEREPSGVIVLENYSVRVDKDSDLSFAFVLLFLDEPDKSHLFTARTEQDVNRWVNVLRQASYQHWRNRVAAMKSNLDALKDAKSSILLDKSRQRSDTSLNELGLNKLDMSPRPSPSPQRQRRNPFLPLPPPVPERPQVPPRTNSPTMRKAQAQAQAQQAKVLNNNATDDLIKF